MANQGEYEPASSLKEKIVTFVREAKRNILLQRITKVMAVFVVFITTYMLILPAITLTGNTVDSVTVADTDLGKDASFTYTVSNVEYADSTYTGHLYVSFTGLDVSTIVDDYNYTISVALPTGVTIPSSLQNTTLYGTAQGYSDAFTYVYKYDDTNKIWYAEITFSKDFLDGYQGSTLEGYFQLDATIDSSSLDESDHELELKIGEATLIVSEEDISMNENTTPNADVTVSKSAGDFNGSTNSITYTIYVKSTKGTTDSVSLSDIINTNGLTISDISIDKVVYYQTGGSQTELTSSSTATSSTYVGTTSATDGTLSMTLNQMGANSSYTITYTVTLNETDLDVDTKVANAITAKTIDEKWTSDGTEIESKAEVTKTVSYNVISKSGTATTDGYITWTITVNADGKNISGFTLTDSMFDSNSISASDVTISGGSDYTVSTDTAGNITGITFTGNSNTNTYTIIYQTAMGTLYLGDYDSETNTATISDGNVEKSAKTEVKTSGGSIDKEFVSSEAGNSSDEIIIHWKSTVNVPAAGIAAGTVITDYLGGSSLVTDADSAIQYMTYSQISGLGFDNVTVYNSSGSSVAGLQLLSSTDYTVELYDLTSGEWVAYTTVRNNNNGTYSDHLFTAFRITFNNAVSFTDPSTGNQDPIDTYFVLSYTTTANTSSLATTLTYTNYMEAKHNATVSDSASYTITSTVAKTDGNGSADDSETKIDSADDTITWKVSIYVPETTDSTTYASFTVTDTLPTGVVFDSVQVKEDRGQWHDSSTMTTEKNTYMMWTTVGGVTDWYTGVTLSVDGQKVTVTINKIFYEDLMSSGGGYIILTYTCSLSDDLKAKIAELDENTTSITFDPMSNSVTVATAGGKEYGADSQAQTVTYEKPSGTQDSDVITKAGSWDANNSRYTYTVIINPDAKDLTDDTDNMLSLTDTLTTWYNTNDGTGFQASLLTDTVKFYKETYNAASGEYEDEEITDIVWYYNTTTTEKYNTGSGQFDVSHVLTASVPDETRIKMVYTYTITALSSSATNLAGEAIKNTAILGEYPSESASHSSSGDDKYDYSTRAGVSVKNNFSLTKYDQDGGMGHLLSDAIYTVYKWDSTASEWVSTGIKFETGANGTFSFTSDSLGNEYAVNTAYYLVETSAPDGYACDTATKYYFYWSDSGSSTSAYPSDWSSYSVYDLSEATAEIYAPNSKQTSKTTSVTVNKTWASGTTPTDSVTVNLYRYSDTEYVEATDAPTSVASSDDLVTLYIDFGFDAGSATPSMSVSNIVKGTEVTITISNYSINGYNVKRVNTSNGNISYDTIYGWNNSSTITIDASYVTADIYLDIWVNNGDAFSESNFAVDYTQGVVGSANNTENYLHTDGVKVDSYTLTATNYWTQTISDLPAGYYDSNGIWYYYYYYFVEDTPDGYEATYSTVDGINSGSITITNTADSGKWDYTAVAIEKAWSYYGASGTVSDSEKDPVTIALYRVTNGDTSTATLVSTMTLGEDAQTDSSTTAWSYSWSNLKNSYTKEGASSPSTTYTYYLAEISGGTVLSSAWSGDISTNLNIAETMTVSYNTDSYTAYKAATTAYASGSTVITAQLKLTNYLSQPTSVSIEKVWKNSSGTINNPASASASFTLIQVLYASDNTTVQSAQVYDADSTDSIVDGTVTLSSGDINGWSYTWSNLPTAGTYTDGGNTVIGTYKYYIVESSAVYGSQTDNFNTAYEANGTEITQTAITLTGSSDSNYYYVVNNGTTATVTNTVQDSIVLPVTGGSGIRNMVLLAGSILMLFAIAVILARQRSARRWSSA